MHFHALQHIFDLFYGSKQPQLISKVLLEWENGRSWSIHPWFRFVQGKKKKLLIRKKFGIIYRELNLWCLNWTQWSQWSLPFDLPRMYFAIQFLSQTTSMMKSKKYLRLPYPQNPSTVLQLVSIQKHFMGNFLRNSTIHTLIFLFKFWKSIVIIIILLTHLFKHL